MRIISLLIGSAILLTGCNANEEWKSRFESDCISAIEFYLKDVIELDIYEFDLMSKDKKDGGLLAFLVFKEANLPNSKKEYQFTCFYSRDAEDEMPTVFKKEDLLIQKIDISDQLD